MTTPLKIGIILLSMLLLAIALSVFLGDSGPGSGPALAHSRTVRVEVLHPSAEDNGSWSMSIGDRRVVGFSCLDGNGRVPACYVATVERDSVVR